MQTTLTHIDLVVERMQAAGLPELAIQSFSHYYQQLVNGETGLIAESDISPVTSLPNYENLDEEFTAHGREVRSQTVLLKLNGGLGTGMGLQRAKSLLPVKGSASSKAFPRECSSVIPMKAV